MYKSGLVNKKSPGYRQGSFVLSGRPDSLPDGRQGTGDHPDFQSGCAIYYLRHFPKGLAKLIKNAPFANLSGS